MIAGSLCIALLFQLTAVCPAERPALATDSLNLTARADSSVRPCTATTSCVDALLVPMTGFTTRDDTLPRKRRKAIDYSEWYYRRLQIHRYASYTELPLFAAEYWLGNKLLSKTEAPASWVKPTHVTVATGIAALFTVNTVTGVWNLWESRQSTDDRALVWSHAALMIASDAGFAITGLVAGDAHRTLNGQTRHKNAALISFGLGTAGTVLMWAARGF